MAVAILPNWHSGSSSLPTGKESFLQLICLWWNAISYQWWLILFVPHIYLSFSSVNSVVISVQVIILIIFRELKGSKSLNMRKLLTFLVLFQYVPRVVQIYRSWKDPNRKANKIFDKTPIWVKAAFNFFLYIIASHVSLTSNWFLILIKFYLDKYHLKKKKKSKFCWFSWTKFRF